MQVTTVKHAALGGVLALSFLAGYLALERWWQAQQDAIHWLAAEKSCQFGTATCQASDGVHQISVSASEDHFSARQPFDIIVQLDNLPAEQIWLQLEGINMYMGVSRYRLQPLGDNRYGITLRLPTCVADTMSWQASVLAQDASRTLGYQFEFEAETAK